jgi:hypothetical protein
MINVDDESYERCGSLSEVDGRSVQGDRIDSSVVRPTLEGVVCMCYYISVDLTCVKCRPDLCRA